MTRRMTAHIVAALFALSLGAHVAFADKLSDFQEAVKNKGCDSIPYSDYRSTCTSQQSYVHEWCDGSRGPSGTHDLWCYGGLGRVDRGG